MRAMIPGIWIAAAGLMWGAHWASAEEVTSPSDGGSAISGEELFVREWLPNDPRSPSGDGLGPVFNDSSCVACHNLGGIGGGGSAAKNVELLVLSRSEDSPRRGVRQLIRDDEPALEPGVFEKLEEFLTSLRVSLTDRRRRSISQLEREQVSRVHSGFRNANSVVLHRFGADPGYADWRSMLLFGESVTQIEEDIAKEPRESTVSQTDAIASDVEVHCPDSEDESPHARMRRAIADFVHGKPCNSILDSWLFVTGQKLAQTVEGPLAWGRKFIAALVAPPGHELRQSEIIDAASDGRPTNRTVRQVLFQRRIELIATFPTILLRMPMPDLVDEGERKPRFVPVRTRRNPTALLGAGLIDSIPDEVLEEAARQTHPGFFDVTGRVSRLKDGRIGRFGWKGQTASLRDFTLTACAVELGLHVPGHPQSPLPGRPDYEPAGFDLTETECDALIEFVRELPAPKVTAANHRAIADYIATGRKLFEKVGCSACHVPRLGDIEGIYSDLLLHDLGPDLADQGGYGQSFETLPDEVVSAETEGTTNGSSGNRPFRAHASRPADATEWRTPPLWGVGQSAPYLHDGRAETLEAAILHHGGEAARSTEMFFDLEPTDRARLIAFLKTLGTP